MSQSDRPTKQHANSSFASSGIRKSREPVTSEEKARVELTDDPTPILGRVRDGAVLARDGQQQLWSLLAAHRRAA